MGFVWEVFIAIALPTTAFALLGRWLDKQWHSSPWMTIVGLFLALGIACFLMMRKAREYQQMMEVSSKKLKS